MKTALLAALLLVACEGRDKPEIKRDPERQRRVIEPPADPVRPLPPHAIRADAVGPYKLRVSLVDLYDQVPKGPVIVTLEVPGVLHWSLLRAEDNAVLVGGEPLGKVSFIAVVGPDVARTESGVHVGSTREELIKALGAPVEDLDRARDPRLIAPSGMRNARALLEGDHVIAFVLTTDNEPGAPAAESPCPRPAVEDEPGSASLGSAKAHERMRFGACMTTGELVVVEGDDIVVQSQAPGRPAALHIPGLVYAAPLRAPGEARDELIAVVRSDDGQQRSWSLYGYRLEGGRLVRSFESGSLYQLTSETARWIGADFRDVDLFLEVTARPGRIEVGGLLTTRASRMDDKFRNVVAITPVSRRRNAKSAPPEGQDAGVSDATAEATDASTIDSHAHR